MSGPESLGLFAALIFAAVAVVVLHFVIANGLQRDAKAAGFLEGYRRCLTAAPTILAIDPGVSGGTALTLRPLSANTDKDPLQKHQQPHQHQHHYARPNSCRVGA